MNRNKLLTFLYSGNSSCLHTENYRITDAYGQIHCGPCYFRQGFWDEIPGRMSIKRFDGLFGSPQLDPRTEAHIMTSTGLIMPKPGEPLREFRRRRKRLSKPTASLFPYISAMWHLTGYQPPLARVLIRFVQGRNELEIAEEMDQSIYNIQNRLAKASKAANRNLAI